MTLRFALSLLLQTADKTHVQILTSVMRANVQIVSEAMQTETKLRVDVNLHSLHLLFATCSQSEKAALRGGWLYIQTEGEPRA